MSDQAPAPAGDGADAEYDAALLAHDRDRLAYIVSNRAFRRRVAVYLLIVFLIGGCALITAGLWSDAVARRIGELGTIIGTFMVSIAGMLSAYFGVGAVDNRTMYGGGLGGMYGGYGGGFGGGMYGGSYTARRPLSTSAPDASSRAD